jgi:hypothetical protein
MGSVRKFGEISSALQFGAQAEVPPHHFLQQPRVAESILKVITKIQKGELE